MAHTGEELRFSILTAFAACRAISISWIRPFWFAMLVAIAILIIFPDIALIIPNMLFNQKPKTEAPP